jgi:hypothetical protein
MSQKISVIDFYIGEAWYLKSNACEICGHF